MLSLMGLIQGRKKQRWNDLWRLVSKVEVDAQSGNELELDVVKRMDEERELANKSVSSWVNAIRMNN